VRPTVVVFARAPALGRVKRRLARDIGPLAALRFHRATTAALLRRLGRDPRWATLVALTPDRAALRGGSIPQGAGDLGERMARALRRPGLRLVVGSDIPAIRPAHIARALRLLAAHDFVFGPSTDGGYWLVGTRLRVLPPGLFRGVRWSTGHALADTLATVPRQRSIAIADRLDDVDDGAAFRRLSSSGAPGGAA
jgi:rSAM/selenodomain-associated transferase 1